MIRCLGLRGALSLVVATASHGGVMDSDGAIGGGGTVQHMGAHRVIDAVPNWFGTQCWVKYYESNT